MNPDCKAGKHDACNGDGWDGENVVQCPCGCHETIEDKLKKSKYGPAYTDVDI